MPQEQVVAPPFAGCTGAPGPVHPDIGHPETRDSPTPVHPLATRQSLVVWYYGIGMALVKMTFSLDAETVARLRTTADRVRLPQSQVVREAIAEYAARVGRLSEDERAELLRAFDRLLPAVPRKAAAAVDAELRELRAARRRGGRRQGQR